MSISAPEAMAGLNLTVAISSDGRRLVYPARRPDGKQLLATRLLHQAQAALLPGTESGRDPFFDPDGQWIGFFAGTQLKKISVQGGAPVILGGVGAASEGAVGARVKASSRRRAASCLCRGFQPQVAYGSRLPSSIPERAATAGRKFYLAARRSCFESRAGRRRH
jgi:hypothetical protein